MSRFTIGKTFTPHSCSNKQSQKLNVNIANILQQGCWKSVKTFRKHYQEQIIYYPDDDVDFMKLN